MEKLHVFEHINLSSSGLINPLGAYKVHKANGGPSEHSACSEECKK
jgi:hypothetical protein